MKLYKLGTDEGVTLVLTADAWSALGEAMLQKCDTNEVTPKLMRRIASGTMTFVEGVVGSDLYRTLHTGVITELDELSDLVEHVDEGFPFELVFSVPFVSGLLETHQHELEQGFGPKPSLFAAAKAAAGL